MTGKVGKCERILPCAHEDMRCRTCAKLPPTSFGASGRQRQNPRAVVNKHVPLARLKRPLKPEHNGLTLPRFRADASLSSKKTAKAGHRSVCRDVAYRVPPLRFRTFDLARLHATQSFIVNLGKHRGEPTCVCSVSFLQRVNSQTN